MHLLISNFVLFIMQGLALASSDIPNNDDSSKLPVNEKILTNFLFQNYSKAIRPAQQVEIDVDFTLKQIIEVDEKTQILTTSSYLYLKWIDSRLAWNSSINGLDRLPLPGKSVWLPDLFIINGLDSNAFLPVTDSSILWIKPNGSIFLTVSLNGKYIKLDRLNFKIS